MSQKVQVELNQSGVLGLLKSEEVQNYIYGIASEKAREAGTGYEADKYTASTRVISSVFTGTSEAYRDNLRNNTLLKVIGK